MLTTAVILSYFRCNCDIKDIWMGQLYASILKWLIFFIDIGQIPLKYSVEYSTEDALTKFLDEVFLKWKWKEIVIVIMMGLSKAFATLDLNIFQDKFPLFGIYGPIQNWTRSFLSSCQQVTKVKGTL